MLVDKIVQLVIVPESAPYQQGMFGLGESGRVYDYQRDVRFGTVKWVPVVESPEIKPDENEAPIELIKWAAETRVHSDDVIEVIRLWNEGDWETIIKEFPEFDMTTPAQQALIAASGGLGE